MELELTAVMLTGAMTGTTVAIKQRILRLLIQGRS